MVLVLLAVGRTRSPSSVKAVSVFFRHLGCLGGRAGRGGLGFILSRLVCCAEGISYKFIHLYIRVHTKYVHAYKRTELTLLSICRRQFDLFVPLFLFFFSADIFCRQLRYDYSLFVLYTPLYCIPIPFTLSFPPLWSIIVTLLAFAVFLERTEGGRRGGVDSLE